MGYAHVDDKDIRKGVKIIHSVSRLLPLYRDLSSMEAEAITLNRAITACNHWLYYCPEIELILDIQDLLGLLDKHTADVDTRSL